MLTTESLQSLATPAISGPVVVHESTELLGQSPSEITGDIDAADDPANHAIIDPPDLDNPDQFWLRRGVPILDVHQRTVPYKGRIIRITFDADALRRIAVNSNARAANRGNFALVTIGHTQPDEPEADQPRPIGYARNFRVGPMVNEDGSGRDGGPFLIADLAIEKVERANALTYPHRSVEINVNIRDPGASSIDAVSLLRRPPERDLGLLTYSRDKSGNETAELTDGLADDVTLNFDCIPGDGAEPGDDYLMAMSDEMKEEMRTLIRECLDAKVAETVAVQNEAETADDKDDDKIDETNDAKEIVDTEEKTPVKNEASSASSTNTFIPGMTDSKAKTPEFPTTSTDAELNVDAEKKEIHMSRDANTTDPLVAELQAENAKLSAKVDALTAMVEPLQDALGDIQVRYQRESNVHTLDTLENDGIEFDRESELKRLAKLKGTDRDEHIETMKVHYRRSPVGQGLIQTRTPKGTGPVAVASRADQDAIIELASIEGIDYQAAKVKYLAQRSA
jgi:hypothetical protein